jgi:hypothetical protein
MYHSSLNTSPFQALYGYHPPSITLGSPPRSNIEVVITILRDRHRTLIQLKAHLIHAQDRMKKFADTNCTERSFVVGDWVYIRLQPYRQVSISNSRNHKLNPRFHGPFEIEEQVGTVAYQLRLPAGSVIYPVLHVSQLKIHIPQGQIVSPHLPITSPDGHLRIYPKSILSRRVVKRDNVAVPQIFVFWTNLPPEDASWEDYDSIAMRFPQFILEDKNHFKDGGVSGTDDTVIVRDEEEEGSARIIQLTGKRAENDGQNLIDSEPLTKGPNSSDLIQTRPTSLFNGYDSAIYEQSDVAAQ